MAYNVTTSLKIWTIYDVFYTPDTLCSIVHRRKLCRIFYLFHWVDRERGGGWMNCNLSGTSAKWREILVSEAEEEEIVLNSKLEWI